MATCVHCGRMIPDAEMRAWGPSLVCPPCHQILAAGAGMNQSLPAGPPPVLGYAFPASCPPQGNGGLGIASLVLGITCMMVAWVPVCGIIGWPLCLAGLILAIIDLCQKNRPHACAIAGLILSMVGFVAPFVCLLGTTMTGRISSAPANLGTTSPATQNTPAVPGSLEAPDLEK